MRRVRPQCQKPKKRRYHEADDHYINWPDYELPLWVAGG